MTLQTDIFGGVTYEANHKAEVRALIEKFPAAANDPSLFYWLMLRERLPWVEYLDQDKKNSLKAFIRDLEGYRRRRQEVNVELGIRR
jgi:hypothetical protein